MRYWVILCCSLGVLAMASCVDLKGVSGFATASGHTLVTIDSLSYGYADYSTDSCYIYNNDGKELKDFLCDCSAAQNYDKALQQEFSALAGYFAALAKLAGSSEEINAGPLGKAVAAGDYGRFSITGTESGIAGGLSTAVTDILTVHYKSKNLADILQKYGPDVDKYIGILAVHLGNLKGEVTVLETQLQVKTILYMDSAGTNAESYMLFSLYKGKKTALDRVIAEYDNKQQLVEKIREGHQQILGNMAQLKSKGLKKRLLSLVADITYLSSK